MKKTKKFAAFVAALALTACSIAPAMMMNVNAANVYVDTNSGNNENGYQKDKASHTYTAYPIFTGTYNPNGLTVTDWATGYNSDGLLADATFKTMKLADKKTVDDILSEIEADSGKNGVVASDVARMLEEINTYDSGRLDVLAELLYKYKGNASGTTLGQSDSTATSLNVGYYVVDDSYTAADTTNDALSRYILQVSPDDTTIKLIPKKSYPTVEKKVKEDDNDIEGKATYESSTAEKWNDVADYDIGEAVPFKLYGTMPATLADYDAYYYKFTDTLGSQFNQPTTITIKVADTTLTATWDSDNSKYTVSGETGTNCRVTWNSGTLTISFENIKAYTGVDAGTIVTVEYTAVLNDTANIGLPGQENAVKLTYSNNPNFEYTPDTTDDKEDTPKDDNGTPENETDDKDYTDETPEDKVIVFTYELDITKIDGTTKNALSGAVFNLKKGNKFAKVEIRTGKFVEWVDTPVTNDETYTTSLTSDGDGLFKVSGIDDGTYSLVEISAPDNYNLLTGSVTLTIDATTVNNQAWNDFVVTNALTAIKLDSTEQDIGTTDGRRGHVAKTIENNKGATLPSTGGIGTTLFYLAGGVMVVGTGVVLVTKKRIGKED